MQGDDCAPQANQRVPFCRPRSWGAAQTSASLHYVKVTNAHELGCSGDGVKCHQKYSPHEDGAFRGYVAPHHHHTLHPKPVQGNASQQR